MFGKISGKPVSSGPAGAKVRLPRVNLDRRFSIVSLTSQGSMSRVARAVDNQSGRGVCLKIQLPDKHDAAAVRTAPSEERPKEGEIGMRIVHPHVVRTFECGVSTKGEHFVVMEFIDGVSLQYIRETNQADLARKIELLVEAAQGLAAVHAAGFIHHDINPRNFLVDREGQVKLIDFGLAVPNTPVFRRPGNRTGTVPYMAPELLRREPTDERIDIFSFGAVAFEFITGRLPYESAQSNSLATMLQRINHEPLDPAFAEPRLHPALAEVLRRAIAKKKEARYGSMTDLIRDLESLPDDAQRLAGAPKQAANDFDPCAASRMAGPDDFDFFLNDCPPQAEGGVFMMKAGPMYLIRKSRHFDRRIQLIRDQYGDRIQLVHAIPAHDIDHAEEYWHQRFHEKRSKGEWFALTDEDVAEFKAYHDMEVP